MCSEGTAFVEHTSLIISIYNQVILGASDTIWKNKKYEAKLAELGVTVKNIIDLTMEFTHLKDSQKV